MRACLLLSLLVASAPGMAMTLYSTTDTFGVASYSYQPSPGARAMALREPMVERLDDQVRLHPEALVGGVRFSARNDLFAPVEVELRLEGLVNARDGNAPRLVRRVLAPRSTQVLSVVMARPGSQLKYRAKLRHAMGDPAQRPQAYRYPFPWRGGPFRLSQGPNGRYSHFGPKGRYAMDIAMPEGTPIIAARGGVVVKMENRQTGRGNNPSGNFVRILHADGTMGVYLHLMRGSVVVAEGQRVAQGEVLGKSGNTGNSSGPHLHFVVQRNVGLALESIPYRFDRPIGGLPDFTAGNP
ncbi:MULTISPECIES: M23 family metallopeptidase [unclassified Pseudomonas]|uniref:M23 family metallopeptidase n=1 Tax=unclassified Pseudomonas TaxID=196821 RepID=UPI00164684F7|nr:MULTISPECIES: M23 family metallopeptidase [unclassified Pseudomonas]MBC3423788.1 M23 family metallopeptidase [Pseudomonas sp. RW3S2]MBC3466183.1 M23 family metallopeptidase [Pseudomonas sp. RW10S2]